MRSEEQRRADVDAFVSAALWLAERADLPETNAVALSLKSAGCYAVPEAAPGTTVRLQQRGWLFPHGPHPASPHLSVIPLTAEDTGLFGQLWDHFLQMPAAALYWPVGHLVVLRPDLQETTTVRGASLLHECNHACRAAREDRVHTPVDEDPPDAYYEEESDLYLLESALWEAVGETAYRAVLDRAAEHIAVQLQRVGRSWGHSFIGLPAYDEELEQVLGPAPTDAARATRKVHFDLQANLRLAEAHLPHPPDRRRTMLGVMFKRWYAHFRTVEKLRFRI